jgi:hypothetical protein
VTVVDTKKAEAEGRKVGKAAARDFVKVDTAALKAHAVNLHHASTRAGALRSRVLGQDGPLLYAPEAHGAGTSLHLAEMNLLAAQRSLQRSAENTVGLGMAYARIELMFPPGKVPKSVWEGLLSSKKHKQLLRNEYKAGEKIWRELFPPGRKGVVDFASLVNNGAGVYSSTLMAFQAAGFRGVMKALAGEGDQAAKIALLKRALPGLSEGAAKNIIRLAARNGLHEPADLVMAIRDQRMRGEAYRALFEGRVLSRIGLPARQVADLLGVALARVHLPAGAAIPYVRTSTGAIVARVGGKAALKEFAGHALMMISVSLDLNTLMDGSASGTAKTAAGFSLVATGATMVALTGGAATAAGVAAGTAWVPVAGWVVAGTATVVAIGLTIKDAKDQQRQHEADAKAYKKAAEAAYLKELEKLMDARLTSDTTPEFRKAVLVEAGQSLGAAARPYLAFVPRIVTAVRAA